MAAFRPEAEFRGADGALGKSPNITEGRDLPTIAATCMPALTDILARIRSREQRAQILEKRPKTFLSFFLKRETSLARALDNRLQ